MSKFSTGIAVLAVVGLATTMTPAFAAPTSNTGGNMRPRVDCTLYPTDPRCAQLPGKGGTNDSGNGGQSAQGATGGKGQGGNGGQVQGDTSSGQMATDNGGKSAQGGPGGQGFGPGPKSGSFNWSRHDRDQFHQRFHGFNFGTFGTPNFSIHLGVNVPHSYKLRTVPRSIYKYYPWFRGYLYFVTRGGDFVIVSPRSYRIVAVL